MKLGGNGAIDGVAATNFNGFCFKGCAAINAAC